MVSEFTAISSARDLSGKQMGTDEISKTDQEAAKVGMENLSELPGRQSIGGAFCMCYHGNSWRR